MSDAPKKRLIEVNFPLKEVSENSVREKNIRQGHISTLHVWWARRPLAASRATALAALLPDNPDKREEYIQLVRDISPWEVVSKDTQQNLTLLKRARDLIREANGDRAPKVLDCFAGGGVIPLEAMRLGCETYSLDYNPVAVLLNKAVLEYPQRWGKPQTVNDTASGNLGMEGQRTVNPLLEEVRRWGNWILGEARNELERFYPRDKDGSIPVGYVWVRTLPCQNPECGAEIPLMRQTWLAKKDDRKVALRMFPNRDCKLVDFEVVDAKKLDFDPEEEGTVSRAHVRCRICGNTIVDDDTRRLFREGKASQRMVAAVLHHPDRTGKTYRSPTEGDLEAYRAAETALKQKRETLWAEWGIDPVPDEPLPPEGTLGFRVQRYGMTRWGDLFNSRQQLTLITFADKVRQVHKRILSERGDPELLKAVVTYLAFGVDRLADFGSMLCVLNVTGGRGVFHTFARQTLNMVWDYAESNPFNPEGAGWTTACEKNEKWIQHGSAVSNQPATCLQGSATSLPWPDNFFDCVLTDPPYYDNIPYADLSDFFYVWLKRTVGDLHPELLATPLTPKADEMVADASKAGGAQRARQRFERMLTEAFHEVSRVLKPEGEAVIVFGHKTTEAWETVINALLDAGLYMTGSWPVHTEMEGRLRAQESGALASSIYMVCRKRMTREVGEFPKVKSAIEVRVRERLTEFWNAGIRGADFFMSAIGPAVEVFGHYGSVEKLSGETVGVDELLDYVEKVVSEFALERILGSAELGGVDPDTRFYLLWRWTYNSARVPFDEARKLANAVGTELALLWGEGRFVSKEKEYVRVLGPKDREKNKKFMNQVGFNTMVDALHRACIYWEHGQRPQLKEHLAQTFGANNIFWRVAQNIADVLPDGDKEKQLLQGLLNVPEARDRTATGIGRLFSEQAEVEK
jgi:putative DNA methylase